MAPLGLRSNNMVFEERGLSKLNHSRKQILHRVIPYSIFETSFVRLFHSCSIFEPCFVRFFHSYSILKHCVYVIFIMLWAHARARTIVSRQVSQEGRADADTLQCRQKRCVLHVCFCVCLRALLRQNRAHSRCAGSSRRNRRKGY